MTNGRRRILIGVGVVVVLVGLVYWLTPVRLDQRLDQRFVGEWRQERAPARDTYHFALFNGFVLNSDGTGVIHEVPPAPIQWWIDRDGLFNLRRNHGRLENLQVEMQRVSRKLQGKKVEVRPSYRVVRVSTDRIELERVPSLVNRPNAVVFGREQ